MSDIRSTLQRKKLFVLDMDGTVYLEKQLFDGSLEFLDTLQAQGRNYLFFTNNSSKDGRFYLDKLAGMGFETTGDHIMTSGDVTIEFLHAHRPGKRVYLVGTHILAEQFLREGIELTDTDPDIVIASFDMELTYEKLTDACTFIRNGAEFIATHPDKNCPLRNGFLPDCGAICSFITTSTDVKPLYLGKPYPQTLEAIMRRTGAAPDEIIFVGDRLYTDIAIGYQNGITTVLVFSGETNPEDLEHSKVQPDYTVSSIKELEEHLRG